MANGVKYTGTGVAMVTPFKTDGTLDIQQLEIHTNQQIEHGVEFLVALGTTAETPTLSAYEKLEIIDVIRRVNNGRVPLVVGAGGNNTEDVINWIRKTGTREIDAFLSVVPYYNKPSQAGIKAHFSAIAAASDIPLILYNVPGRTGTNMSANTTLELAGELGDKVAAVKEASGDFAQIMEIIAHKPEGFQVLSGDDAITLPMISTGAEGVISVIGNAFPALFSGMVRDALSGDLEASREKHYKLMPFYELAFREGNPCGVKAIMQELGYGDANLRLPLIPATEALVSDIQHTLTSL